MGGIRAVPGLRPGNKDRHPQTNAIESINARLRPTVNARGHLLSVTWNQGPGSGSLRYGLAGDLAGSWKESSCPSLSSRRSGPCWAGTS